MYILNIKRNLIMKKECLKKKKRMARMILGLREDLIVDLESSQKQILGSSVSSVSHHCFFLCKLSWLS